MTRRVNISGYLTHVPEIITVDEVKSIRWRVIVSGVFLPVDVMG